MECPYPDKKKYTAAEAKVQADYMYHKKGIQVVSYKCPAGGHSHIGHRSPFQNFRQRRLRRR